MKKIKKIGVFLILTALIAGCNDLLDLYPEDRLSDETMWTRVGDFELAANRFYAYFPTHNENYGRDQEADLVTPGGNLNTISNSSYTVPVTDNFYNSQYSRLRAINYLFHNAESYPNKDQINKYIGEAHFFRAFVHWLLFRNYGPVVYLDQVVDVDDPLISGPRMERNIYADRIIQDLQQAIDQLPEPSGQANTEVGRINKGMAHALLATFTLYEGTWQKYHINNAERANQLLGMARDHSKLIMDSGDYELFFNAQMGTTNSYRYLFILENVQSNPWNVNKSANKEYIIANRFDENLRQTNQNITHTLQAAHFSPTLKMINMYLCDDGLPIEKSARFQGYETFVSVHRNRDPRMNQSIRIPLNLYWSYGVNGRVNWTGNEADLASAVPAFPVIPSRTATGYNNLKFCTERNVANYQESQDAPIVRLAEIYLTYAEALFELNGSITDAQLDESLNKIRSRAGMPRLTNAFVSNNGLNMLQEIRRERTVELYAEGKRLDDLMRWKTAEVELAMPLLGAKITGEYAQNNLLLQRAPRIVYNRPAGDTDAEGYFIVEPASSRQFQPKHYQRPLPSYEIQVNPNLVQNPGWD